MHRILLTALVCVPLCAQVRIMRDGDRKLTVEIDGKPFTEFFIGKDNPKPYLHPLRTISGASVTRGFPMVTGVAGEPDDHPHHRGLWFAHGDVNGYDFWANEASQPGVGKGKGTMTLVEISRLAGGKDKGTLDTVFEWKIPDGSVLLTERRSMTFYSDPRLRMMDFDATLSPEQEVKFGDTKEGMFAIRLAATLQEDKGGKLTNAQGKSGEKEVWGKRSEWADYSGVVEGKKTGVAIFDHPGNPRFPTYWHARNYGLFATNIFGLHDFENDASRDGSLTIKPGQPLRFRFRVVIHPGLPAAELRKIADAWAKL